MQVKRRNSSSDKIELDSRSFLRHDFAHFAIEIETPLLFGYWGSVADGSPLAGEIDSSEIWLAESLAGPIQTLIRNEAVVEEYLEVLSTRMPDRASIDLAKRIFERVRQLRGLWSATPYGSSMTIYWNPQQTAFVRNPPIQSSEVD